MKQFRKFWMFMAVLFVAVSLGACSDDDDDDNDVAGSSGDLVGTWYYYHEETDEVDEGYNIMVFYADGTGYWQEGYESHVSKMTFRCEPAGKDSYKIIWLTGADGESDAILKMISKNRFTLYFDGDYEIYVR